MENWGCAKPWLCSIPYRHGCSPTVRVPLLKKQMGHSADTKTDRALFASADSKTENGLQNRLLLSIPAAERELLEAHLEKYRFRAREVLHEPHARLKYAYFPNDGVISLVVTTEDGSTVEAAMVGREGLAGIAGAVGINRSPLRQMVQITGEGYRIKAEALAAFLESAPRFQAAICRYAVIMGMQMAQTAACNRLHDVAQRLTRWLLMARDRADLSLFPITHDFLAAILGTDRPSVSLAAQMLQKKGIIDYKRGKIVILNPRKLESASCECYRVIRVFAENSGKTRAKSSGGLSGFP